MDKKRLFKVMSKKCSVPRNVDICADMGKMILFKVIPEKSPFLKMLIFSEIWAKTIFFK